MIGYPKDRKEEPQMELHLRPIPELDVGLGSAAQRFMAWAEEWALQVVRRDGEVWTDDLYQAAEAAHRKPPDDSLYGRFWAHRARAVGLRRTSDERTSRARRRNGAKARRWVLGEVATVGAQGG